MTPSAAPAEPAVASDPPPSWVAAGGIVAAVLLAYTNSFPGAFFFDDGDAILQNPSIRTLHSWRVLWPPETAGIGGRPLANLTFALNYAIGHYNPLGYHIVNLALHLLTALLLFGVVRRTLQLPLLRERFGAHAAALGAIVALLWALQPIQTSITDYASQRTEGMMAALYLATLYAFIRSVERPGGAWPGLAVVACVLGMATKEDMVTAPAMILLYDRTFVAGSFREALRRRGALLAGLAATWVVLAGLMYNSHLGERGVGFGLGRHWYDYGLTECRSVVRYLKLTFWPHPLIFDYGPQYIHGLAAIRYVVILAMCLAGTAVAVWRAPALGFGAAWFFVTLSPSSSVVPVVQQPCAENRPYLPMAGLMALGAVAAYRAFGRRALAPLLVVAVAFGYGTFARNPVYRSELAVWWDTVARHPNNERAENNLGNALLKDNRTAEALPYFETALRLSPTYADAHNNRGVTLLREGHPADAIPDFKAAIADKKGYADAYYNLGEAYLELNRNEEAIQALREALKLAPDSAKAHNNIGIALLNVGKVQESTAEERRALELNPNMPEAHYNLGNALTAAGRPGDALPEFEQAVRLDPKFAKAYNNAGVALLRLGRPQEAAKQFREALRLNPNYPEAKRNLALVAPHPPS